MKASREGQVLDLFTKAIDQLASDKVSVRMGGVYSMEQIATNPLVGNILRGSICALLATFVRQRAPWPAPDGMASGATADDVGAAIATISRRSMVLDGTYVELERIDLRKADLPGRDLSMCCFAGSNLAGANLAQADLRRCTFTGADLRNANLAGANLAGANLEGADLSEAVLDGADLDGTTANNDTTWPPGYDRR